MSHDALENEAPEVRRLLRCPTRGERRALLARLLEENRPRLRRLVELRLHPQLRRRVDPSDVLQDAYLRAERKLEPYLADTRLPFFLWLRRMAGDALHDLHRRHLDAEGRDARMEVSPKDVAVGVTSESLAHFYLADRTSPSQAAQRSERKALVEAAIARLDEKDREIIALRFFEQLSSRETAQILGIEEEAARKRFTRAISRFRESVATALPEEGIDHG